MERHGIPGYVAAMPGDSAIQTGTGLAAMRLTICGIGDLDKFRDTNVSHMVSILDPGAAEPDGLTRFPAHARLELRFHDIIDEQGDMVCPQPGDIERLLRFGRAVGNGPAADAHLLVHCHAGISRSTAAMTLLLAQAMAGQPPERALGRTLAITPNSWPNLRMIEIGDGLLGFGGGLTAAVRRHYADMVRAFPALAGVLGGGRHLRDRTV